MVNSHNSNPKNGFKMAINKFSDLSHEEFIATYTGYKPEPNKAHSKRQLTPRSVNVTGLPTYVDWRTKGYVNPVKDQGGCGSCWIFAGIAAIEGQYFKKTGTLVSLSEQQIVDCIPNKNGCNGGWPTTVYSYNMFNKGIENRTMYPYTATV